MVFTVDRGSLTQLRTRKDNGRTGGDAEVCKISSISSLGLWILGFRVLGFRVQERTILLK